jgi:hypothetical protein
MHSDSFKQFPDFFNLIAFGFFLRCFLMITVKRYQYKASLEASKNGLQCLAIEKAKSKKCYPVA